MEHYVTLRGLQNEQYMCLPTATCQPKMGLGDSSNTGFQRQARRFRKRLENHLPSSHTICTWVQWICLINTAPILLLSYVLESFGMLSCGLFLNQHLSILGCCTKLPGKQHSSLWLYLIFSSEEQLLLHWRLNGKTWGVVQGPSKDHLLLTQWNKQHLLEDT